VFAKQGFGRTAITSAVCKRHGHEVIARYFFDANRGVGGLFNHVRGLIQSIVSDMLRSLPEYLDYVVKAGGGTDGNGTALQLGTTWKEDYNQLIRDPLNVGNSPII